MTRTLNIRFVTVGHGGFHAYAIGEGKYNGTPDHPVEISGYATDIEGVQSDLTRGDYTYDDGAVIVDLTTIPHADLVTFAVGGPMVNPYLPNGTVHKLSGKVPWNGGSGDLTGRLAALLVNAETIGAVLLSENVAATVDAFGRQPDGSIFGNAGSFDKVSADVYVALATAFGATVHAIS